mmetsp:Transcript_42247/g.106806  ORF Transcript_42247/g.106806 Transcript_42247/m.106806 type:complete len:260 (-) Transcript_42247:363-1142(-)
MQRGLRRRRAAAGAAGGSDDEDAGGGAGGDAGGSDSEGDDGAPLNRKEAKKKAQREARRAREAAQEARDNKKNTYDERRKAKDEEREAREAAEREAAAKEDEERQRKEDEDAAQWMNLITVDEGGSGEAELAAEDQGLLGRFVDFIRERKTVLLEEVAAEFGLRVTDVINRVEGLEQMGRLTGVMDDRGKFIYISKEEMEAVAGYIKSRGRISITELAQKSNTFIDLDPKEGTTTAAAGVDFNIDTLDEEPDPAEAAVA